MTWAELVRAKDAAWAEHIRLLVQNGVNDIARAAWLNYEAWQDLIDGEIGRRLYSEYQAFQFIRNG